MNRCAKCEKVFEQWTDYYLHMQNVKCVKVMRPINTSGRTKEQIVQQWEDNQPKGVIYSYE